MILIAICVATTTYAAEVRVPQKLEMDDEDTYWSLETTYMSNKLIKNEIAGAVARDITALSGNELNVLKAKLITLKSSQQRMQIEKKGKAEIALVSASYCACMLCVGGSCAYYCFGDCVSGLIAGTVSAALNVRSVIEDVCFNQEALNNKLGAVECMLCVREKEKTE